MASTAAKSVNAGIYVRISLDVAGEGLGVERQENLCRELAERKGWHVAGVYSDNDVSASSKKPRPEYQRMLADLEAGDINGVVVYAIDRLTRRPMELEQFIELVESNGVALANVAGDIQLDTPMGQAQARMMGMVARLEAQNIGKRVRDQKQQRAAAGIPHKGRHRLYGYDDAWQPIDAEAAIIREAFIRRASGESTTAIANDLTKRGVKTVAGNPWKAGTLANTLTKSVYAGFIEFKGEEVAPSQYPALIDRPTFDAAQSNLANDSAGTNARRYLLSGILVCGYCLTQMKGNPSNHMYRCSATYGGCGRLSVRIAIADRWAVFMAMNKHLATPTVTAPVRDYESEIAVLEVEQQRLIDLQTAGGITLQEALPRLKERRNRIQQLRKDQAASLPRTNFATQSYLDFQKMNLSQQRAFLNVYVSNIKVGPSISKGNQPFNPARFEFHYADGVIETPTLEEYGETDWPQE